MTPSALSSLTCEGVYRMTGVSPKVRLEILLVEDSPNDALLMVEALKEGALDPHVTVIEDGEEATDYLFRRGAYAGVPPPDLILLDLHLPRKNGHEVLREIKQQGPVQCIPVVLLTSTTSEKAILDAYDLHANCCVLKPTNPEEFTLTVRRIETFWLQVARRHRRAGP